jgi:hypothetical protein
VPREVLQYRDVGSAPHLFQMFPALTAANFELEGGLWYLGLAPKFLMHALVTGSLHRKKVFIEAMQPFPVEQLDNRSVCSQAGLIKARTVTTAQEL